MESPMSKNKKKKENEENFEDTKRIGDLQNPEIPSSVVVLL